MARGIPRTVRGMIVQGFFEPVIERILWKPFASGFARSCAKLAMGRE